MAALQDRFAAALEKRGERVVKRTKKYIVYSRAAGEFYYLGRAGSLRLGKTISTSIRLSDTVRALLLESAPS